MKALFANRLAVGLCLAVFSFVTQAKYSENLVYKNYAVQPSQGQGLLEAIKAVSPFNRADGNIFHGHTDSKVSWSFDMRESSSRVCTMGDVRVHLEALITLPELLSGSARQRREFAPYIEALRKHEQGHFQLYQATAREIERSLSQLPQMRKCKTLESEANRIGNLLMKTGNEVNVEYDRRTEHGATQGARLSN